MNAKNIATKTASRKPAAKSIEAQPAPAVINGTLENLEKIAGEKPKNGAERHLAVSTQTMINAITNAAISARYALQLELATGLCLFAESSGIDRDSKRALQEIYVQAGFDAADQYKADYKTVRRRIDAAAELYDWLGAEKVAQLIENRAEMAAIQALVQHLEQYNLKGINSVLALVGKPVKQPAPKEAPGQPKAEAGKEPEKAPETKPKEKPAETTSPVAELIGKAVEQGRAERGEQKRRKTDSPDVASFATDHIQVFVAPEATRNEIVRLAMDLLEYANTLEIVEKDEKEALAA